MHKAGVGGWVGRVASLLDGGVRVGCACVRSRVRADGLVGGWLSVWLVGWMGGRLGGWVDRWVRHSNLGGEVWEIMNHHKIRR